MGFLDRFSGIKDRIEFNKDFDINESLAAYYGDKNIKESYLEISKVTKKKFKETYDISDQLLEKYAKVNGEDIQNELMKKYLKMSMDDLNKEAIEKEQLQKNMIEEEVDSSLEGVDKDTKDQVKKDLEQEQKEKGSDEINLNDKKKEFQAKIYQPAYKRMYSDYSSKVMKIKNAQYDSMAVALGTKEAVEIIAMEKNLEKIDLLYHNHTGRDISNLKGIKEQKQEFKSKFDYNQKGIEYNTDNRTLRINQLYAIREERYREYIRALKDPTKSPQEKAMFKMDYEKSNLDLIQSIPSLSEYSKDLQIQEKNEKLVEDAHLEKSSAVNSRFDNKDGKIERVTESKMADNIYDVEKEQKERDARTFEESQINQRDSLEKGDYKAAKEIGDAQRDKRIYDENIEQMPKQATVEETKKEVREEERKSDANFFASLRQVNNIEDKSPEELEKIVEDRNDDIEDKIKENAYKEQVEQETEYQRYRKNKRPNE